MCWSEEEQRISPQEMRTIAASVAALDDDKTVTLGCLVHLTTHSLSQFPKHINTQPIYATARLMLSLYLNNDPRLIRRVYTAVRAMGRAQATFDYLHSIPL